MLVSYKLQPEISTPQISKSTGNANEAKISGVRDDQVTREVIFADRHPSRVNYVVINSTDIQLRLLVLREPKTLEKIIAYIDFIENGIKIPGIKAVQEHHQNKLQQYKLMLMQASTTNTDYQNLISRIKMIQAQIVQIETKNIREIEFDELFAGYNEKQLALIGKNLATVQLTTGCSSFCKNCDVNALPLPRRHLSWNCVNEIVDRWGKHFRDNQVFLFWASDPLDWQDQQGHNYLDIEKLLKQKIGYTAAVTTTVPRGKEEIAKKLWHSTTTVRISPSNVNIDRLIASGFWSGTTLRDKEASLGKPGSKSSHLIATNNDGNGNLRIQAGRSYDFNSYLYSASCVRGVLIDPDGVYNIASAAISPQTPNGHIKIEIPPEDQRIFRHNINLFADMNHYQPHSIDTSGYEQMALLDSQSYQALYEAAFLTLFKTLDPLTQFCLSVKTYGKLPNLISRGLCLGESLEPCIQVIVQRLNEGIAEFNQVMSKRSNQTRFAEINTTNKEADQIELDYLSQSCINLQEQISAMKSELKLTEPEYTREALSEFNQGKKTVKSAIYNFEGLLITNIKTLKDFKNIIQSFDGNETSRILNSFAQIRNYAMNSTAVREEIIHMLQDAIADEYEYVEGSGYTEKNITPTLQMVRERLIKSCIANLSNDDANREDILRATLLQILLNPRSALLDQIFLEQRLPNKQELIDSL